jgi:Zn-dependent M28 family amino/carboxypeptidase
MHRSMRAVVVLPLVAGLACGVTAVAADTPHAFSPDITAGDFAAHVRTLSSDAFAGRDPATAGEAKTLEYLQAQLRRMGLEPGNGDSFLQAVPFQLRLADLAHSQAGLRVGGRDIALDLRDDAVLGSDTGGARVQLPDSPIVFLGYGIEAPEEGWNDFAGVDLRGKTAVFLAGEPDGRVDGRERFDGRRLSVHSRSAAKFEHAARHGAVAALVIHDTAAAGYDWAGVRLRWHNREFALRPADPAGPPVAVQGWLSNATAKALFAQAGVSFADASRAAAQPGFHALPLGDATFHATLAGKVLSGQSANVVAILRGATRPDEAVLYSAHWDHLGTQPGKTGDAIYNGALDNASGVAALLEIAGRFAAQPRPARSVVFLMPTLEELGLLGSLWYTRHPVVPLAKTVADINFDMVVPIGRARNFVVIGYGYSQLDAEVAPVVAAHGRTIDAERGEDADHFLRSDHASFARAGVPVLYMRGGTQSGAGPGGRERADPDRAWLDAASVYHTPDDEFGDWDLRGIADDIAISHEVGRRLAEGDAWPDWNEHTPFRAIRDASRAGQ